MPAAVVHLVPILRSEGKENKFLSHNGISGRGLNMPTDGERR